MIFFAIILYAVFDPCGCNVGNVSLDDEARKKEPPGQQITFIAINDIYRLAGVANGTSGGLARVRALRKQIEAKAPKALLLHAGDFLSPSLVSTEFDGASMIDVMNNLDGDPHKFDSRMFVTFGNHEFDISKCTDANPPLNTRVAESQFTWLAANLDFANCPGMNRILKQKNVLTDGVIVEVDNVKVGLFGIGQTPDQVGWPAYPTNKKAIAAARRSIACLRERGAKVIVALTHLSEAEDEELIKEFAGAGLDLLIGGHDHTNMTLPRNAKDPRGFKADSDAVSAWHIDVNLSPGAKPSLTHKLIKLDESYAKDVDVANLAKAWTDLAELKICTVRAKKKNERADPRCLDKSIGRTQSLIELEEKKNRTAETGFGDWLADLVANKNGADVAIINAGILGLNEDLKPGSELLLRHVVDIFRYDDVVAVKEFPAKTVCAAIKHGFKVPGMGAWPHISGIKVHLMSAGKGYDATDIRFPKKPEATCENDVKIKVAGVPYLLCSGDGYVLLPKSEKCMGDLQKAARAEGKKDLSEIAEAEIAAAGINQDKDGRVQFK